MDIPKISIIVPVYNAGTFFKKRLDTLVNQTLKEIEIILVLDCPTDGSDKVAEEYALQDNRIMIIHNPHNLHIGRSRNEGLKRANGEYISFSDHDDYSELDMFEKMYEKAKESDADVIVSDFYRKSEKSVSYFGFPSAMSCSDFHRDSLSFLISCRYKKQQRSISSNGLIWNQIYKREFLMINNITFRDNRKVTFEDRLFLIEVYHYAKRIVLLPQAFYYHIYNQGSAGSNYTYRSINFVINYLISLYDFLETQHIYKRESIYYSDGALLNLYAAFRNELRHRGLRKALLELSKIRNNKIIQRSLKNFFIPHNFKYLCKYPVTKLCFLTLILCLPKNHNIKPNILST